MFTPPPSPRPIPVDSARSLSSESSGSSRRSLSPHESDRLSPSPSRPHRAKRPPSIILTPPSEGAISPLPSPLPVSSKELPLSLSPIEKKRIGARTRLVSLVLVPAILILVTLTTRVLSHPVALDLLTPSSEASWSFSSFTDWHVHKRHPNPDSGSGNGQGSTSAVGSSSVGTSLIFPSGGASTSSTPTSTASSDGASIVPTVPASAPVLPTPFPQALDSTLGQNFSTKNCQDFFANMTQSPAFRSCRPFSLLLHGSASFINAQSNLTLFNNVIWGTCNTNTPADQCTSNMDWFRATLQSSCATELSAQNALVTSTLTGMQAYALMRQAGCLVNPSTNTYCLLDAVRASSASDIYYFGLALGTPLPARMTPTCSACSKSLLSLYAPESGGAGTGGNATATTLPALGSGVYSRAASTANAACGQEFAVGASSGGVALRVGAWTTVIATLAAATLSL